MCVLNLPPSAVYDNLNRRVKRLVIDALKNMINNLTYLGNFTEFNTILGIFVSFLSFCPVKPI